MIRVGVDDQGCVTWRLTATEMDIYKRYRSYRSDDFCHQVAYVWAVYETGTPASAISVEFHDWLAVRP